MCRRRHGCSGPVRDLLISLRIEKHWKALAILIGVASAFDFWDHVSRPGQPFAEAPYAWFGFTAASSISVWLVAFSTSRLLGRLPIPSLAADTAGVGLGIAAHLLVTGYLWDRIFWNGGLHFDAVALPVAVSCLLYLVFRGAFAAAASLYSRVGSKGDEQ
ncbi:hypothetical protein K3165_07735 [Qipengyuania sp. 1XM1-15A]|uniref:hypothetical protein n=1 Tax=Qipengyuania xiamenensis TaxID=2867237 RepID=UPI001C87E493|nr:hypothetical protein [Qipengyuania xiamenensis]MBX7532809.1 hypothetical protein [Qipengyuania xiamenensis]